MAVAGIAPNEVYQYLCLYDVIVCVCVYVVGAKIVRTRVLFRWRVVYERSTRSGRGPNSNFQAGKATSKAAQTLGWSRRRAIECER